MEQQVILKSNRYGINLILNENLPFEELLDAIILKFHESDKFFKNASIAITFSGRHLSTEEEIRIIDAITEQMSIHIICVLDSDEQKELDTQAQIEEFLRRADAGEEEMFELLNGKTGEREFFVPVRDIDGKVIGYFERHEMPWNQDEPEVPVFEYWKHRQ